MEKITDEQYREAIKVAAEYRIQNQGFYVKVEYRTDSNKIVSCYYDSLDLLLREVWHMGVKGEVVIEDSNQITKEEYEMNHHPF